MSKQGFSTKLDAEGALREVIHSADSGTLAKRSTRTLGDYLGAWHALQDDRLRATTWRSYAMAINRIKAYLGQAKLQALEPRDRQPRRIEHRRSPRAKSSIISRGVSREA